MGLGLGLRLGLGGAGVLGAAGPIYDPDALTWFEAVEATGATFGPDSATVSANKAAWSDWVVAQKAAASPIAGRSNWQALTAPGVGFIQPLMGLSTFNVPPLFGGRTFTGFVSGDHNPLLGLRAGTDRVITSSRDWSSTPQDDVGAGIWVTEASATASASAMLLGDTGNNAGQVRLDLPGRTRFRSATLSNNSVVAYNTGAFPRSAFLSRSDADSYTYRNDVDVVINTTSDGINPGAVEFMPTIDARAGICLYGLAFDTAAVAAACVALSEAITWP